MDEKSNVELIRHCYDCFLKGDVERLLSFMADDIEWSVPQIEGIPFSGKRHGIEQVREFFRLVGEAQKPLEFHPGEVVAQGDRVVVLGHYDWVVAATGVEFRSDFAHSFHIRNGKVSAFQEFLDTHAAAEAYRPAAKVSDLGAMPSAQCPSIH